MSLVLGPLWETPLHRKPWCGFGTLRGTAGCPRYDYRITAGFTDPDILNGGPHRAVDTGNASTEWPLLSPCRAAMRHLHHFDGARGREWNLGGGWTLEAWHLHPDAEDPAKPDKGTASGPWRQALRGAKVGLTGNTGADLPNGQPMPPHTHIVLKRNGVAVDPEPHLYIEDEPGLPIKGATNDMAYYQDVPDDHPHAGDIEWARQKRLTGGISTDPPLYGPANPVTRAQMATFLRRLYQLIMDDLEEGS